LAERCIEAIRLQVHRALAPSQDGHAVT
jgi:hypothetical protein